MSSSDTMTLTDRPAPALVETTRENEHRRTERHAAEAVAGLRIALGVVFLAHGPLLKVGVLGMENVAAYFESLSLPGSLAWLIMGMEGVGGLLLVLGVYPALTALGLIPVLVGAIVYVHAANGWLFSTPGGGWEYPLFLLGALLVVARANGGAYTLRR